MLRTSGGRGEYELAGTHGPVGHWDLKGRPLRFVFGFGIEVPGYCRLTDQGGKPRLRLDPSPPKALHLYRIAAAVLLMPPPVRELNKTTSQVHFWDGSYSTIAFGVKVLNAATGILHVETLEIGSRNGLHEQIDVAERLASVAEAWEWAESDHSKLGETLRAHRSAVVDSPQNHDGIVSAARRVLEAINSDLHPPVMKDPIERICELSGISPFRLPPEQLDGVVVDEIAEEDEEDPFISRVRLVKKARLVLDRGTGGAKFRQEVREAYRDRCLATGAVLKACPGSWRSGGEAAHIYPFSKGGANSVANGILLSPTAHWAFDQGFLKLGFDSSQRIYQWSWDDALFGKAVEIGCELEKLNFAMGPIDPAWLPDHRPKRPNTAFIRSLSELLAGRP